MLQVLQLELSLPGAMAEVSPHGTERQALLVAMKGCDRPCPLPAAIQALLAKDAPAPSMAKYTSRVGRARQANQNARNQAHSQATHTHTHTQPKAPAPTITSILARSKQKQG